METTPNAMGKFLDPDAIIAQLDVTQGSVVADFGCGPGYFSLPFAKSVGIGGRVFSLDILPQALETVAGKAKNSGIINIVTARANLEKENGSKLENDCADWVVIKDMLFQNNNKEIIIGEAYRILKPGGKVIFVEWNDRDSGIGPDKEIRVPRDVAEKIFAEKRFIVEKDIDAGDFHYAFVAVK